MESFTKQSNLKGPLGRFMFAKSLFANMLQEDLIHSKYVTVTLKVKQVILQNQNQNRHCVYCPVGFHTELALVFWSITQQIKKQVSQGRSAIGEKQYVHYKICEGYSLCRFKKDMQEEMWK